MPSCLPGTVPSILYIDEFYLYNSRKDRYCCYTHLAEKKGEIKMYPRSLHNWWVVDLDLLRRQSHHQPYPPVCAERTGDTSIPLILRLCSLKFFNAIVCKFSVETLLYVTILPDYINKDKEHQIEPPHTVL